MIKPAIYKNEVVCCPECSLDLHRITRDVYRGDRITEELFAPIGPVPRAVNGSLMNCPECRRCWARSGGRSLHVKGVGWV